MTRYVCCLCGADAAAEHHVVAACHSPHATVPLCRAHHHQLDQKLYYAGVHRRDRSTQTEIDRDYAVVRGSTDLLCAILEATGADPQLIQTTGRAQYGLGQHLARHAPPKTRIGPSPPTSGAFQIKTARLKDSRMHPTAPTESAPDWFDQLRITCSLWATLIEDYTSDEEISGIFARIANGLENEQLRAWVGGYRAADLDEIGDVLARLLTRDVDALVALPNRELDAQDIRVRELIQSTEAVAEELTPLLRLLLGLTDSSSPEMAQAAVDAYVEIDRGSL